MACPSRNSILRGFFFIVFVLIYLMCERWMMELKVVGSPIYEAHVFNHFFLLWTFKQCLLALMYPLWKAIHENWIGLGCLKHAEVEETETDLRRRRFTRSIQRQDTVPDGASAQGSINSDSANAPLIERTGARQRQNKNAPSKFLFLLPSLFSQANVVLVYFGVKLTYSSSVIMFTGTASLFVTLLSLAFLAKQIASFMWVGVVLSTVGFAISGLSDYFHSPRGYEPYGIAAGDLLYVMGQITITTQMIYEEKYLRKLSIHPMYFLGGEGIYRMVLSLIMLFAVCVCDTDYSDLPNNRIEDIADAALQFANSGKIVLAFFGSLISYVVFTYLGMILIKDHGAMSRVMIESLAWCLYWLILVLMRWEQYCITQIPGLVLVPCGVLIFSHIVANPCSRGGGALDPYAAETFNEIMAQAEERNGSVVNANGNVVGGEADEIDQDDNSPQNEQNAAFYDDADRSIPQNGQNAAFSDDDSLIDVHNDPFSDEDSEQLVEG